MKNKLYVIGISGGSGAGKTFFLNCFLENFSQGQICLLSQDDYYKKLSNNITAEENRNHNFDLPECVEIDQFEKDIFDLLAFKTVYKQQYNFNNPLLKPNLLQIKSAPILIIEGLFIYHYPNINSLFNYRIFIEASEEIALQRRVKRDALERGYSLDDVNYKWNNHVMPAFNEYLLPQRFNCDLIVNNNTNDSKAILSICKSVSEKIKYQLSNTIK
jgi:uridine kinase